MNHSNNAPWSADNVLTNYVNSDNKVQTKNRECHNGKYKELYERGQMYRFFVFYEFSHGGHKSITICKDLDYDYIWKHFRSINTTQRVWGIFDSCHAGSMIKHDDVTPHDNSGQESAPEGILSFLDKKFTRRAALLQTIANNQESSTVINDNPRLTLWASTGSSSYGWYFPGSSTSFVEGMAEAFSDTYWDAGSRKYLYR